jgi:hypothetical protein
MRRIAFSRMRIRRCDGLGPLKIASSATSSPAASSWWIISQATSDPKQYAPSRYGPCAWTVRISAT